MILRQSEGTRKGIEKPHAAPCSVTITFGIDEKLPEGDFANGTPVVADDQFRKGKKR